jgi:hypothetical protein
MRKIHLEPPLIQGQTATFRWRIEPATDLYRQSHFSLRFPASIDLATVPERLWWDVFLICLHPHWLVLQPCEVHLPLRLGSGERQFWLRLLRNGLETLEAYGPGGACAGFAIDICDGAVDLPHRGITGNGCATSFSSGKDSLLQAGLLSELTQRPLLVATTSPMPPLHDHETERRRQIFAAIQARRDIQFVEVHSDFRGIWDNGFAGRMGYRVGINELTDAFLYTASLLIAGAALGATRLFLASEVEVQESTVIGDKIIQHSHFMYSAATQRALSRLLDPYGISYGSLTWPLYSMQVQRLLWARYPDLADLQYSCWRVGPGEATCSRCDQCLRIAVTALADGRDPRRMGIDLARLLDYAPNWPPLQQAAPTPLTASSTPDVIVSNRFDSLVLEALGRVSLRHLAILLAGYDPRRLVSRPVREALAGFRRLRRQARLAGAAPPIGFREAFCDWLEPELRDRLLAIYRRHFDLEPRRAHLAVFERSRMLTERAASCLEHRDADRRAA